MYKMIKLCLTLFVTTLLVNCSSKTNKNTLSNNKNALHFARHLKIIQHANYSLVELNNPTNKKTYRYCVTKNKKVKAPNGYTLILSPVRSIIAFSGTETGMLDKLNQIEKIRGVSDARFVYNARLINRINTGKVADFKGNQNNAFEQIVACKSPLLLYSGFEEDYPKSKQLEALGTLCIPNFDWKENHPLGKAEWIVFIGLLIGKEKEAFEYIEKITRAYTELKMDASHYEDKPSIFCGNLIGDTWYSPAGESFIAKLINDAGGSYVYRHSKGIGSLSNSMEKIFSDNKHTQLWLHPGNSKLELILQNNPKMSLFDCVQKNQVYCYSHNMNKFWELSAIEPQQLLADLIKIFHKEALNRDDLYFYRKVKSSK